ncbi:hypothetical protein N9L68_01605 [bacterium]|nr:hypothetical protein [bacterium]
MFGGDSEDETSPTTVSFEEKLHTGPVPRVSMDYFHVPDPKSSKGAGAQCMSTKELQKRLREMGKSGLGSRLVFVQRYEREISQSEQRRR